MLTRFFDTSFHFCSLSQFHIFTVAAVTQAERITWYYLSVQQPLLLLLSGSLGMSTPCLKNIPPLACYNFDAHKWILIFFGKNVTDKVGNQKMLYYATSITCASALLGKKRKHENHIFHSIGFCYTHNAPVRYVPKSKNCHL